MEIDTLIDSAHRASSGASHIWLNQDLRESASPTFAGVTATTADINGGSIDAATLGTNSAITEAQIDNININGNDIINSTSNMMVDASNGGLTLSGNGGVSLIASGGSILSGTISGDTTADAANMVIGTSGPFRIQRSTSSARRKKDIVDIPENVKPVLRPRRFKSTSKSDDPNKIYYGLIAEEVYEVLPEAVFLDKDGKPDALDWNVINSVMFKQFYRMQSELNEMKQRIRALENGTT